MLTRSRRTQRDRRRTSERTPVLPPNATVSAAAFGSANTDLDCTVDLPCVDTSRASAITATVAASPVACTGALITGPTTVRLTFASDVSGSTALVIPANDPLVRSGAGGFLNAGSVVPA